MRSKETLQQRCAFPPWKDLVKKGWKRDPDAYTEDPRTEALSPTADG